MDDDEKATIRAMKAAWANTIRKCYNERHADFKYYGARGITVCDEWRESFENFFRDMGLRPEGLTLERQNNDGNYCKSNCVWATRQVQAENRRVIATVEWQGRSMTVAAWEREFGWKAGVLKARLGRLGYSIEEAFTKPVKCGSKLPGKAYPPRKKPDMSNIPRGVDHPHSKLSRSDVLAMREAHFNKKESFSALAREYKVTTTTASNACQGKGAYKDIP